jgi:PAS domain S-box-containing protein
MEVRQTGPRAPQSDQFRLLVDSVREYAIFLLSPDGLVMSWNAGAERIKGYTASEIIGKHFSTFYQPADVRNGKPEYELRIATSEGRYEEEGWRVRKDGSLFWANVVITALRDERGEIVGFAKVTRDLTERKSAEEQRAALLDRERQARLEAEQALQQLRVIQSVTEAALEHLNLDELLAALIDRIVDQLGVDTAVVLLMSEDGSALVARAARGLEAEVESGIRIPVGRGFAGRIAQERRPIVLDEVRHSDVLNPILRAKGLRSLLGVPLLTNGRVLGVLHIGSLSPARFTQRDVDGLVVVADRIALAIDRAQLFETARAAKHEAARAEEAVRIREEFLSVAAHELKTPVTAAKVATQLLKRMFASSALSEPQTQALESVDMQITRLARLVGQLLDTVRIASGTLALDLDEVDLAELVRSVVTAIAPVAAQHRFVVDAPQRMTALLDAPRIERVLTNLLDNAVKFSPEGGAVEVRLEKMDSTALLTVRDHGLGVAPEHRLRLFDRFYQAHPNRSGLGLGLHISRDIVERHGGTIYLDPPPDGGSRFVISLPLVAGAAVLRALPREESSRMA